MSQLWVMRCRSGRLGIELEGRGMEVMMVRLKYAADPDEGRTLTWLIQFVGDRYLQVMQKRLLPDV